jgi:biopolymer transport protein TolR
MSSKLTPRQRAYVRKRTTVHDPDPSEMAGELNIVPFLDVVVNIIIFLLATTQAVMAIAEIEAQLPQTGRSVGSASADPTSTLNLSVTITRNGVIVGASGGFLAPGCESRAPQGGITVSAAGGRYDWTALTQCARRVKSEFAEERKVILSADPDIEFEHVIAAMDALRSNGTDELFPEVLLSAGVR